MPGEPLPHNPLRDDIPPEHRKRLDEAQAEIDAGLRKFGEPRRGWLDIVARNEARALAERAGIDMLDDHDQFIDDLTETLLRFTSPSPRQGVDVPEELRKALSKLQHIASASSDSAVAVLWRNECRALLARSDGVMDGLKYFAASPLPEDKGRSLTREEQRDMMAALRASGTTLYTIPTEDKGRPDIAELGSDGESGERDNPELGQLRRERGCWKAELEAAEQALAASRTQADALAGALESFERVAKVADFYVEECLPREEHLTFPRQGLTAIDPDGPPSVTLTLDDFRRAAAALALHRPGSAKGGE